jgi:hypothetical protein
LNTSLIDAQEQINHISYRSVRACIAVAPIDVAGICKDHGSTRSWTCSISHAGVNPPDMPMTRKIGGVSASRNAPKIPDQGHVQHG